jgi:hypothetical protein
MDTALIVAGAFLSGILCGFVAASVITCNARHSLDERLGAAEAEAEKWRGEALRLRCVLDGSYDSRIRRRILDTRA